jgi:hypothetical protein
VIGQSVPYDRFEEGKFFAFFLLVCSFAISSFKNLVRVALRLAVNRKSFRLGDKPLETHDHPFFPTEHLRLLSLRNILSDERMGLSFTIAAGPRQSSHSQV